MISLPIFNSTGAEVGTYEFDPADLASGINKQLLHDVVVMYQANRRVGTVRTKARGEVSGTTQKMYRQKGTGRARAGSVRSPVRRGGGHTFAKRPIDYSYRLPRKAVQLATKMALLSKFEDGEAVVMEDLSFEQPKTREMASILKALNLQDDSVLLVIGSHDAAVWKSARNIEGLAVLPVADLNAYDLLHQRRLLITQSAIDLARGLVAETVAETVAG